MRSLSIGLVVVLLVTSAPSAFASPVAATAAKPKLLVLQLQGGGGLDPQVANAFTESVTAEVASRGFFDVVSAQEVQTLLGVERQKQMLGCADDAQSCLTELAGALGAEFVLSGSLARLGQSYQLSLQTLDSRKAQPIGRAVRIASDLDTLRQQLPWTVAEATATPLPQPPSPWLSYGLMAGGGAATLGGGLLILQSVTRTAAINRELRNGEQNPAALQPLQSYVDERDSVRRQRTLGIVGVGVGLAVVGAGIYLFPRNPLVSGGSNKMAFTFGGNSVGIAGVLP